jgi:hypothetical protein
VTELLRPYTFSKLLEHNHGRNLAEQIRDGELALRADSLVRYNFAFVVGTQPIGLFAICSDGAGKLTMVRAWNASEFTRDPFTGLDVPCRGAQFAGVACDVQISSPIFFLIEFEQDWTPSRKVAFKANSASAYFCSLECADPNLKFEALDLARLEILG